MPRPSFQFYPADWRSNAKLRRCSDGARGAWVDIICVLHDADEYGLVRWPLLDLARAAGVSLSRAKELADKGVLKGSDGGAEDYVFRPFHAGKHGNPVVLAEAKGGPLWYSSRLVRDEWVRRRRGAGSHFGPANPSPQWAASQSPSQSPKGGIGDRQVDGPSSSSSSSSSGSVLRTGAEGAEAGRSKGEDKPDWWPKRDRYGRVLGEVIDKLIYDVGKAVLGNSAGGQITKLLKLNPYRSDRRAAMELLLRADDTAEPAAWFAKALQKAGIDEPVDSMHTIYPDREYRA